jgi:hypothetical protein
MLIRDPEWKISDPGWTKLGSGIWDKHSGSATLPHTQTMSGFSYPIYLCQRGSEPGPECEVPCAGAAGAADWR